MTAGSQERSENTAPDGMPTERGALYYYASVNAEGSTASGNEMDETFYEITADDLRARQRELVNRVRMESNRPLLPRAYVERKNRELKRNAYKNAVVRFTLQNDVVIQACFLASESVSSLFNFVRGILRNAEAGFDLRLARERLLPNDTRNLLEADIAPATRLHLHIFRGENDASIVDENKGALQLIDTSVLVAATENEAEMQRQNWLASNAEYRSFERILCENDIELRDGSVRKRGAEPNTQSQSSSSSSSMGREASGSGASRSANSGTPKWFKKT